jgi:hypothetical protein
MGFTVVLAQNKQGIVGLVVEINTRRRSISRRKGCLVYLEIPSTPVPVHRKALVERAAPFVSMFFSVNQRYSNYRSRRIKIHGALNSWNNRK